uniref:Uncharacterized protein n=1 Tax=Peronospora matthiolae TaxID=2874970 RepID=A0AAV1T3B1_9STRA
MDKTVATLLDTVITHFGGEGKFAPFLLKDWPQLFALRRMAWKAALYLPRDGTRVTSGKLKLVQHFIGFRPGTRLNKVQVMDTVEKDFGSKTELARDSFKFAVDNTGVKRADDI